jgi:hypothetical protein
MSCQFQLGKSLTMTQEQDRMDQLLAELSRLREGETLTKPNGWLENRHE